METICFTVAAVKPRIDGVTVFETTDVGSRRYTIQYHSESGILPSEIRTGDYIELNYNPHSLQSWELQR